MIQIFGQPVARVVLHFIGVGGIGMSGLAEILARAGGAISGSDSGTKGDFERLTRAGVKVERTHDAKHVPEGAMVVVSTAIREDNPELLHAQKTGLRVVHRADVLAEIMANYSTVAVSGTHGKTSTTALIYSALRAGGMDAGVINGGVLQALGTNAILPAKKTGWLVVEADESDASFLKLKPNIAVVTNIEPEHMETYGTEDKLVAAFEQFANAADMAVLCGDDPNTAIVASRIATDVITYGFGDDEEATYDSVASDARVKDGKMVFDAVVRGGVLDNVVVALPGMHYVLNSLAALTVVQAVGGDVPLAADGLATFQGVGRRFTHVGTFHQADVIDDYGHHPTEIATTLDAARRIYSGRVVAVIQPHRFTRLRDLMDEFAGCAKLADVAIILPVYAAGEAPIDGVNHQILAEKMDDSGLPETVYAVDGEDALMGVLHDLNLEKGDVVLCLGAGDITSMAAHLAAHGRHA
jgi:UDP-N-acetylmuramate--alanine ligase